MILKCPFCRTAVQPGRSVCPGCAQPMLQRCVNCNEEISVRATLCKYCGEDCAAPTDERPVRRPDIEFLEDSPSAVAWEEPKRGFFSRWWGTVKDLSFHPAEFMRRLPRTGGYSKPIAFVYGFFLQFLLVAVAIAALVGAAAGLAGANIRYEHTIAALAVVLALFPLGYLAIAAGNFLGAAFWHVVAKLFGGKGTYQGTFRVVAYASGAQAWGLIPYVGGLIHVALQAILYYHGFREVHGLSKGRAIAAILIPFVVAIAAAVAILALVVSGGEMGGG